MLFNAPVDLTHDASFAFDVKLGYCDCGDGLTFLLQSNSFGVQAPAAVINEGGLRLEIGKLEGRPASRAMPRDEHVATTMTPRRTRPTTMRPRTALIPGEDAAHGPRPAQHPLAADQGRKAELAQDVWHRVDVSWDASAERLSYSIDGKFAGELTGDVLDRFLGGRTEATFGFVGAELADGTECHEVRLSAPTPARRAARLLGGDRSANLFEGGAGDDRLFGARGADLLRGGAGDDVLLPGRGGDRMLGGAGDDTSSSATAREAGRGAGATPS